MVIVTQIEITVTINYNFNQIYDQAIQKESTEIITNYTIAIQVDYINFKLTYCHFIIDFVAMDSNSNIIAAWKDLKMINRVLLYMVEANMVLLQQSAWSAHWVLT